eukprot:gb/GECG01015705.1/.p1 GENE.gb/GECG01015705.1/~~gb/GECG01015705.1/.p1  ORF type:complete len:907 (+),score=169.86 gb/GECG01015705.1/:1-2721(+)
MSNACPLCGGLEFASDDTTGNTTCVNCGNVTEQGAIVSSVEFEENAGGTSSIVGRFVSATSNKPYGTTRADGYSASRASREDSIEKAKKILRRLASQLRLPYHLVEAAQRLYMIALQKNFSQGRRLQNVVAACLYIACRREKCAHMLIDFADALQTDLYALGSCFVKFTRALSLKLPLVDPSLYIHRFASKLNFGKKQHTVAMTALRLVARMRRDWMQTGRRPEGICAACLLIAARVHGFPATRQEVTETLRVADITLRNRLAEFGNTPSSQLTPQEFDRLSDIAQSSDENRYLTSNEDETMPPSFIRGRLTEQRQMQIQEEAKQRMNLSDTELAQRSHLLDVDSVDVSSLNPHVRQALENSHMLSDEELFAVADHQGLLDDDVKNRKLHSSEDVSQETAVQHMPISDNLRDKVMSSALMNTSWAKPVSYAKTAHSPEATYANQRQSKERKNRLARRRRNLEKMENESLSKHGCLPGELSLSDYDDLVRSVELEGSGAMVGHQRPAKCSLQVGENDIAEVENLLMELPDGEFDPKDEESVREQERIWEMACVFDNPRLFREAESEESICSDAWMSKEDVEEEAENIIDLLDADMDIPVVCSELANFDLRPDSDKNSVYIAIAKRLASVAQERNATQEGNLNEEDRDVKRDALERRLLIPVRYEGRQLGGPTIHAESLSQREVTELANADYDIEGATNDEQGETLSDVDDEEIQDVIVDEEEAKHRRDIWVKMNSDYLEEQRQKLENPPTKSNQRNKQKKGKSNQQQSQNKEPASGKEATSSAAEVKKTSKKLNYQALEKLDEALGEASNEDNQRKSSTKKSSGSSSRKRGPERLAEELASNKSSRTDAEAADKMFDDFGGSYDFTGEAGSDSEPEQEDDETLQERSKLRQTLGLGAGGDSDSEGEF